MPQFNVKLSSRYHKSHHIRIFVVTIFVSSIILTLVATVSAKSISDFVPSHQRIEGFCSSTPSTTTRTTGDSSSMAPLKKSDPITSTTHSEAEAKMARFWNRLANFYYKQPIRDEASYLTKIEITRKYLTAQSRVLEFGCGTGGTALLHAPYVEHYHAIDVSSNMIAIAKEQQRLANEAKASDGEPTYDLQFECIGIDVLQAPPASYDVVLGLSILHLLPQKKDVLEKVHGLVTPGGYFISSTMCMKDFSGFFLRNILSFLAFLGVVPPMDPFTKSELIESIKSAGFTIEEEYHPENDKGKAVFLVARKN